VNKRERRGSSSGVKEVIERKMRKMNGAVSDVKQFGAL